MMYKIIVAAAMVVFMTVRVTFAVDGVATNGASGAISDNLPGLAAKADLLDKKIAEVEGKGKQAPYQKITLCVARLYCDFIRNDANDKNKAVRRFAAAEYQQVNDMLDRALAEVEMIMKDKEFKAMTSPQAAVDEVSIRNGALYCGGRPVFLSGCFFFPFGSDNFGKGLDDRWLKIGRELGLNLFTVYLNSPLGVMEGFDKFNDKVYETRVYPALDILKRNGYMASLYTGVQYFEGLKWLKTMAPEIPLESGHGLDLDLDHPLTSKVFTNWFTHLGSRFGGTTNRFPNIFCYLPMGEEFSNLFGSNTVTRYTQWLKDKYGGVDKLNSVWNTHYPDCGRAAGENMPVKDDKNKAMSYDWYIFNQHRFNMFFKDWMTAIRSGDPGARLSRYSSGIWPSGYAGHYTFQRRGVDIETAIRGYDISGWDGGMSPFSRALPAFYDPEGYSILSFDSCGRADLCKSLEPDNPIYNPEWGHSTPAEDMRTALWLEHLHGMRAHVIWTWSRRYNGEMIETLKNPIWAFAYPAVLEAWSRTMLELRGLAEYIIPFAQAERKVRILYSEASAIQDLGCMSELSKVYQCLSFLDYPVGFATENTVKEGGMRKKCDLLIIPGIKYVKDSTAAGIRDFQAHGGKVLVSGRDVFKYDEYGRERKEAETVKTEWELKGTHREYAEQLDKFMTDAGIERQARLVDEESGKHAWGVELREIKDDKGRRLIYMVNLNRYPVFIELTAKQKVSRMTDLINRKALKTGENIKLEPKGVMLMEVQ